MPRAILRESQSSLGCSRDVLGELEIGLVAPNGIVPLKTDVLVIAKRYFLDDRKFYENLLV